MSKTLYAFGAGFATGYWFATRPREQAFAEVKHAAETTKHVAEGAAGFAKEKISDVKEARAHSDSGGWQDAPPDPLLASSEYGQPASSFSHN
ncbi:hypothetical protein [Nocardioides sp. Kera G14]|uniref:hypothetical protein n=1 Tax=Nocardioides sp. Kera G14 TaxID=2884264 RepID=UPI001D0FC9C0|nr:hypothetical protein [Nocardioides sp. Kera G14]UDY24659.1 hypothetical protein LH076_04960 [Nocardioides sp. Kera G14]